MNRDIIEGNWKELKGTVKERWGKLTDDDLDKIAGKRDQLVGRLQKAYGYQKEDAERELDKFEKERKKACCCSSTAPVTGGKSQ